MSDYFNPQQKKRKYKIKEKKIKTNKSRSSKKPLILFLVIVVLVAAYINRGKIIDFINNLGGNHTEIMPDTSAVVSDDFSSDITTQNSSYRVDDDGTIYHLDFSTNDYIDSTEVIGDTHLLFTKEIKQNRVMAFDGDEDYIECGTELNLTDQYTFSTYLRCDDVSKSYSGFFAKYEYNHYGAYAYSINKGHVNVWITTDTDKHYVELESTTELVNGQWYYITIVKDSMNLKLYVNGVKEAEYELPGYIRNDDLVTIGRQALMFDPKDQLQFTGCIAFISIYDTSLSDEVILEKYNDLI